MKFIWSSYEIISYEYGHQICDTSAGCLRSIYPSLGMRQHFGDVIMDQWRHYQPAQLSDVTFN